MGFMTFEQMKSEVSMNLAGRTAVPERLSLWVNWALLNMGTFVEFDEMRETVTLTTVVGTTEYALPSDLVGILTVELGNRKLKWIRRVPNTGEDDVREDTPTHWTRRENNIILWPTPTEAETGIIEYTKEPAVLEDPTDVSPFKSFWDVGLVMLATHHAFLSIGEQDLADRWLGRFLGYAGSRKAQLNVQRDTPRGGVNIAWTEDDISQDRADY